MALAQTPQREPAAAQDTMDVNRFECVVGAGRIEPTRAPEQPRAQRHLVQADQELGEEPHCSITLRHSS